MDILSWLLPVSVQLVLSIIGGVWIVARMEHRNSIATVRNEEGHRFVTEQLGKVATSMDQLTGQVHALAIRDAVAAEREKNNAAELSDLCRRLERVETFVATLRP